MNMELFPIPALVATFLLLYSAAFLPAQSMAAAKVTDGLAGADSSGSSNTACDLPPYSENLNETGKQGISRFAELPSLDSTLPAKVATATFAMG